MGTSPDRVGGPATPPGFWHSSRSRWQCSRSAPRSLGLFSPPGGVEIVDAAQTVGVVIALAVAWTAIGSGIGMLIPVTAAAVAAPLVWIALIEGILPMLPFGDFMNNIERFLPWISGRQLLGFMDLGVSNAQAWIVLGTWTAVIAAVGIVTATRRDVR